MRLDFAREERGSETRKIVIVHGSVEQVEGILFRRETDRDLRST